MHSTATSSTGEEPPTTWGGGGGRPASAPHPSSQDLISCRWSPTNLECRPHAFEQGGRGIHSSMRVSPELRGTDLGCGLFPLGNRVSPQHEKGTTCTHLLLCSATRWGRPEGVQRGSRGGEIWVLRYLGGWRVEVIGWGVGCCLSPQHLEGIPGSLDGAVCCLGGPHKGVHTCPGLVLVTPLNKTHPVCFPRLKPAGPRAAEGRARCLSQHRAAPGSSLWKRLLGCQSRVQLMVMATIAQTHRRVVCMPLFRGTRIFHSQSLHLQHVPWPPSLLAGTFSALQT